MNKLQTIWMTILTISVFILLISFGCQWKINKEQETINGQYLQVINLQNKEIQYLQKWQSFSLSNLHVLNNLVGQDYYSNKADSMISRLPSLPVNLDLNF